MTEEDHSDPNLAAALSHLPVDQTLLTQALAHLLIDKPILRVRVAGSRIEFHLLGGEVKSWDAPAAPEISGDTPDPVGAGPRARPNGGELPPAAPPGRKPPSPSGPVLEGRGARGEGKK
jgi:hypothetical protein